MNGSAWHRLTKLAEFSCLTEGAAGAVRSAEIGDNDRRAVRAVRAAPAS